MEEVIKTKLHPRNKHNSNYNFKELCLSSPDLTSFVKLNPKGIETIDFADPKAVKCLNKALLKFFYQVENWDIPENYLCPPIPGRADYIHYIADLLGVNDTKKKQIACLDIGVGANCIYPLLASQEYGWNVVGSDIDPVSLSSAKQIVALNPNLKGTIELRLQQNSTSIFEGIIQQDEFFDMTICNPPFHESFEEAQTGSLRKLSNLSGKKVSTSKLNFGGQSNELWCKGGEEKFIRDMIYESKRFASSVGWFTTLVAKQIHLKGIYKLLHKLDVLELKTIQMAQGNKISRIVAWRFK